MSQVRQFIDQIAAGQSADAKESLENILSGKAFESLDLYKKEIASSIFGGIEEAKECDTEKEDDEDDEDEKEDKMKKEEFDQLDEVSKETLKSYVKKASVDAGTDQLKMIRRHKGDTVKTGRVEAGKNFRNIGKQRTAGISKALDKLTKEEAEQLDEISPGLKKRYIAKAGEDRDKKAQSIWRDDSAYNAADKLKLHSIKTREKGMKQAEKGLNLKPKK